jgi:hypothetical protein
LLFKDKRTLVNEIITARALRKSNTRARDILAAALGISLALLYASFQAHALPVAGGPVFDGALWAPDDVARGGMAPDDVGRPSSSSSTEPSSSAAPPSNAMTAAEYIIVILVIIAVGYAAFFAGGGSGGHAGEAAPSLMRMDSQASLGAPMPAKLERQGTLGLGLSSLNASWNASAAGGAASSQE